MHFLFGARECCIHWIWNVWRWDRFQAPYFSGQNSHLSVPKKGRKCPQNRGNKHLNWDVNRGELLGALKIRKKKLNDLLYFFLWILPNYTNFKNFERRSNFINFVASVSRILLCSREANPLTHLISVRQKFNPKEIGNGRSARQKLVTLIISFCYYLGNFHFRQKSNMSSRTFESRCKNLES